VLLFEIFDQWDGSGSQQQYAPRIEYLFLWIERFYSWSVCDHHPKKYSRKAVWHRGLGTEKGFGSQNTAKEKHKRGLCGSDDHDLLPDGLAPQLADEL
jgi:hypothetical protein